MYLFRNRFLLIRCIYIYIYVNNSVEYSKASFLTNKHIFNR